MSVQACSMAEGHFCGDTEALLSGRRLTPLPPNAPAISDAQGASLSGLHSQTELLPPLPLQDLPKWIRISLHVSADASH